MDRALALYAGFLLGLLVKLSIVLAVLSLVSLYVLMRKNRQKQKWEVSNCEHKYELDATGEAT